MTEEAKLLRVAIEASIAVALTDTKGEYFASAEPYEKHATAQEAAEKAWREYDLCIWVDRYAP